MAEIAVDPVNAPPWGLYEGEAPFHLLPPATTAEALAAVNARALGAAPGAFVAEVGSFGGLFGGAPPVEMEWSSVAAPAVPVITVMNVHAPRRRPWRGPEDPPSSPQMYEFKLLKLARAVVWPKREKLYVRKTRITARTYRAQPSRPGEWWRGFSYATLEVLPVEEMPVTPGVLVAFDLPPVDEIWRIYDVSDASCIPEFDYGYDAETELLLRYLGGDAPWYRAGKKLSVEHYEAALWSMEAVPPPPPDCRALVPSELRRTARRWILRTALPISMPKQGGSSLALAWRRLMAPAAEAPSAVVVAFTLSGGAEAEHIYLDRWDGMAWVPVYDLSGECYDAGRGLRAVVELAVPPHEPVRTRRRAANAHYETPWAVQTFAPPAGLALRPTVQVGDLLGAWSGWVPSLTAVRSLAARFGYRGSYLTDYQGGLALVTTEWELTTHSGPAVAGEHYELVDRWQVFGAVNAIATATRSGGAVVSLTLGSGGNGYLEPPQVVFSGGSGAEAIATVGGGAVTGLTLVSGGTSFPAGTGSVSVSLVRTLGSLRVRKRFAPPAPSVLRLRLLAAVNVAGVRVEWAGPTEVFLPFG